MPVSGPWQQPKSQTPLEEQRTADSLGTPSVWRVSCVVLTPRLSLPFRPDAAD